MRLPGGGFARSSGNVVRGSGKISGFLERVRGVIFFGGEISKKWRNGLTPRKMRG